MRTIFALLLLTAVASADPLTIDLGVQSKLWYQPLNPTQVIKLHLIKDDIAYPIRVSELVWNNVTTADVGRTWSIPVSNIPEWQEAGPRLGTRDWQIPTFYRFHVEIPGIWQYGPYILPLEAPSPRGLRPEMRIDSVELKLVQFSTSSSVSFISWQHKLIGDGAYIAAVPEPATGLLLVAGLCFIGQRRR